MNHFTPVPIAGCAVAITRNNQIAYLQSYVIAAQATDRPFTIATPSPIGSISKTLTTLGLPALVEQGKLDLDTPSKLANLSFHPARLELCAPARPA